MTDDEIRARLTEPLAARLHPRGGMSERAVARLADALLPVVRGIVADELRATADAWRSGAWADTPRHSDRVADRIGAARYVTGWLHARARAALDGTP